MVISATECAHGAACSWASGQRTWARSTAHLPLPSIRNYGIAFDIAASQAPGIVGEADPGKTSIARALLGLSSPGVTLDPQIPGFSEANRTVFVKREFDLGHVRPSTTAISTL